MKNISRKNNISPSLFTKKINTNYKLVPFNVSVNDTGRTKYLPPVTKEWRNSVYNYNSNNTINYPVRWIRNSLLWVKLSNSGELLKLQVPSYIRKGISGWINYSCMVTSLEASERNVDYRGSKSDNLSVKEQRVYGSWCGVNSPRLRCTLTGFERNLEIKNLSKQIISKFKQGRYYTNIAANLQCSTQDLIMNPWYITGFSDAEGCFTISLVKNNKLKTGWVVRVKFQINLSVNDKALLEQIQKFFCLGRGIYLKRNEIVLQVDSIKGFKAVIDHFDKYPLISQKYSDYLLFKQVVYMMLSKEHLTEEGLRKIVAIKATLNRGLPSGSELDQAFPNIVPVQRPLEKNVLIQDPYWLVGFTEGEGCFFVVIQKSSNTLTGFSVSLRFQITQHIRDIELMRSFINLFGCGEVVKRSDGKSVDFKVNKFPELVENVIPFFERMPLLGVKAKNLEDFCKVANIMKAKGHLTKQGLDQILGIKTGMNTGRVLDIED